MIHLLVLPHWSFQAKSLFTNVAVVTDCRMFKFCVLLPNVFDRKQFITFLTLLGYMFCLYVFLTNLFRGRFFLAQAAVITLVYVFSRIV